MDLEIVRDNPWLAPYSGNLQKRVDDFMRAKNRIVDAAGSLDKFSQAYKEMGVHHRDGAIVYKEWAPNAAQLFLCGEFNDWNGTDETCKGVKDAYGVWTVTIPDVNGRSRIEHNTRIKVHMILQNGESLWRIPAWINYAVPARGSPIYEGVFWNPEEQYVFKNQPVPLRDDEGLLIYETHVGMAGIEPRVHTYKEFKDDVLPMVKENGYNAVQVMAVMEHAYYASFGYQVTNFFAASSRFGTPEELMELIDTAHGMGIHVFLDLIHSHACKNVEDGINQFDGTDHLYFHDGGRGYHPLWDSRLFNYDSLEVQRFLLSNLRFFMDVYQFDGFRFDGVTSIIYKHHGNLYNFTSLDDYFNDMVDYEAITYLMLANDLIHSCNRASIAEEVSGMIGIARKISAGGIGFDYRLGMATPDLWIKFLKEFKDEEWDMGKLAFTLSNRPYKEKTITYCESHDQALVGDKTIAFWLMDKEMYTHMSDLSPQSMIVDRGIALHKLIRLITFGLGGEAYLTFMGNEFGHPEWIDFPRAGNNDSFAHCLRRFDLPKDPLLKYKYLLAFEKAMLSIEHIYHFLNSGDSGYITLKHESDKIIAFERKGLFWVINFHPHKSFSDYHIGIQEPGAYGYALSSDDTVFGGFGRIDTSVVHHTINNPLHNRNNRLSLYLPARCGIVLHKLP